VVQVAAAIEDDRFQVRLLRALGEQLADLGRLLGLVALEGLLQCSQLAAARVFPSDVVDELRLDPGFERKTTRRGRSAVP
jgi:hypothetical protein